MYRRIQPSNNISGTYVGTRVATQESETPSGTMTTTTRILPRTLKRSSQPHRAEYNDTGSTGLICRCSNPEAHGDAFTRRNHTEVYEGREMLDIDGNSVGWEDLMHRLLDAAGKDQITPDEADALAPSILSPEAVEMKRRKSRLCRAMVGTGIKFAIESNVIWHGRINPKRHPIIPVMELQTDVGAATVYDRYGILPGAYNPYGSFPGWGRRR